MLTMNGSLTKHRFCALFFIHSFVVPSNTTCIIDNDNDGDDDDDDDDDNDNSLCQAL